MKWFIKRFACPDFPSRIYWGLFAETDGDIFYQNYRNSYYEIKQELIYARRLVNLTNYGNRPQLLHKDIENKLYFKLPTNPNIYYIK